MGAQIFAIDSDLPFKARNPLTGHRTESWRVDLLNRSDVRVAPLLGVKGGEFQFNVAAAIRGGGSIEYQGSEMSWQDYRVQPWYRVEAPGAVPVEWPLGVFLVATPGTDHTDSGRSVTLELYDKTLTLQRDKISRTYQVPKGANLITTVRTLLAEAGQTRTAIESSSKTHPLGKVYEAGTSRMEIINDLLETANYFGIWVDGYGVFRAGPYTYPSDRGQSWQFKDDSESIYSPEFRHDFDTFNVPNTVVLVGTSDGTTPAPVAVAEDLTGTEFSVDRVGVITRFEEGVDAADQSTLQALAQRYLREGQQVGSTYQIRHAPIPLDLQAAVGFQRAAAGIDITATVQSITYSMAVGALCSTTLREYMS